MTPLDFGDTDAREARGLRIAGVVIGVVTNTNDPDKLGRVKLKFPWLSTSDESAWARVAAPMAGQGCGFYFLPDVDDEVLVAFEHGDLHFPFVLGSLWNGKDRPPLDNPDGKNNVRLIKSRSGHVLRLTDENGKEKIEIVDANGKNSLVLDTASNTITITSGQNIKLSAAKGTITLDAQKIDIKSSTEIKVEAQATMTLKGALVNIN